MDYALPDVSDTKIVDLIEHLYSEGGAEHTYTLPIPELEVPGISRFYGVHLAIWQLRDQDIQQLYPLNSPAQRARFLAWSVVHGQLEYQALRELQSFWNELAVPAALKETEWSGGISKLLQLIILGRPDLAIDPSLNEVDAQEQALDWYFLKGGYLETGDVSSSCPGWQRAYFLNAETILGSKFGSLIARRRSDVRSAFDIETLAGQQAFQQWMLTHGMQETALKTLLTPGFNAWPADQLRPLCKTFGVNLIGYAYGELGIGEDVRMAAHALCAAHIPFTIINIRPGDNIRQHDRSVEQWVSEEPLYMFNIVCLTALEHLRVYLEKGRNLFAGRYNIGYWPWELHHWPKKWKHCFKLVDEMWASSQHIARSAKAVTHVPIVHMPMAVISPIQFIDKIESRKKFGLPSGKTLFVFSFDGNSYTKRKNPMGIVNAFTSAFPSGLENAGLVIKCMRPDASNAEWSQILHVAEQDKRITIIDAMLSRADVLELYEACDCFVSLHRAEGFGRGIAEALLLGLEVITTHYGGNVGFCEAADAHLIPYTLAALAPGDYVEAEGNYWGEPDVNAAAVAMQIVATQKIEETLPSEASKPSLDTIFSPHVIGERYRKRLEHLASVLPGAPSNK